MIKNYVVHIRSLKQALNHELISKKVHRVIHFNQEAWLNSYISKNNNFRKEAKNERDFRRELYKLLNDSAFGKTMENVRKHRYTKLVTADREEINYFQNLIVIQQNGF